MKKTRRKASKKAKRSTKKKSSSKAPKVDVIAQAIAFLATKGMATQFAKPSPSKVASQPSKETTNSYFMRPHDVTKGGNPTHWWCQVMALNIERDYWDRMVSILGYPTEGALVLDLLLDLEKKMVKEGKIEPLKRKA